MLTRRLLLKGGGCRAIVAAMGILLVLLITFVPALCAAQPKLTWQDVFKKASDWMWDCYKEQALTALKTNMDADTFAKVLPVACSKQIHYTVIAEYNLAIERGHHENATREEITKSMTEALESVQRLYVKQLKEQRSKH